MDTEKLIEEAERWAKNVSESPGNGTAGEELYGAKLLCDLAVALRESEERARKAEHDREAARAELAQPAICPNCTAKMRRLDRMDSAGHAAYELDKARKDAAGQNKRAQKAEQEAKALRAELARFTTPRPIVEAPRDGTWIGAVWEDMTPEECARFGLIAVVRWNGTRWEDSDGDGYEPPTHYIPLPEVKP